MFPGRSVYLVAYRGYGASSGEPGEAALVGDALALYDNVRARQPQAPIAVIGRSLGSSDASYLAERRPIRRICAGLLPSTAWARLYRAHYPVFPVRLLMRDRYQSTDYLPRYAGPLLVLRGGCDEVIPPPRTPTACWRH